MSARRVALGACLLALALALNAAERLLPPLPVPGAHLGLANGVTLVVLWRWGAWPALALSAGRVALASVLLGRLGAPGFWISLAGAVASVAVMGCARAWAAGLTGRLVPLSVLGGVAHNLGQLAAVRILVGTDAAAWLMPALVMLGAAAGGLVGEGSRRLAVALGWRGPQRPPVAGGPGGAGPAATEGPTRWWPGTRGAWVPGAVGALGLVALLVLAAGGYGLGRAGERAIAGPPGRPAARVDVEGSPPRLIYLDVDSVVRIETAAGHMVVEVRGGRVRVRESTCPEKLCVHAGWIGRPGQAVVCVPGRAVLTIVEGAPAGTAGGAGPEPAEGVGEVDAVTR